MVEARPSLPSPPPSRVINQRSRKLAVEFSTLAAKGVGAQVRQRQRQTTGVVIGYSPDRDRVRVKWDDSGEVTHILTANLERVPAVGK
jgi:hypothetical protein